MKFRFVIALALIVTTFSFGQEKLSKGDIYFHEYKYQNAIQEYIKQKTKWPLSVEQELKLADSYFKVKDYKNAALIYINVNKKNDSVLSTHRVNKMLQSLSKNGEKDRVSAFLNSKSHLLSRELMENYEFNKEILSNKDVQKFEIKNLPINSAEADFSPAFYKDKILFSSGRKVDLRKTNKDSGQRFLNIFTANVSANGEAVNATSFARIPSFKFHEATPFYSEKIDKLFYVRSNAVGNTMIFNDNGKNALAIGSIDNTNTFKYVLKDLSTSFYYPFFDVSNDRLYFAANFEDSYGGTDLYFVHTNNGQIMSAPINLGPKINTPANEIAPYIHNESLYYSSDIFYGFGGMDIYKTNVQVGEIFSIPINLGTSINSEQDDFGFIVKNDKTAGLLGYFSSNRKGGKGKDDIYSFSIGSDIGLKTFVINGSVVSLTNRKGIDKAVLRLFDAKGSLIKEVYTTEDGDYNVELPWYNQITIKATKEGYSTFSVTYNEEGMIEAQKTALNMGIVSLSDMVEEKEGKTVVKLNKFYFDKGKSVVTPLIAAELDKVTAAIQNFPQMELGIETHTSSKGYDSTNKRLSQKRADAIKAYLLQKGASVSNIISVQGFGEEQIINRCTNGVYCLDFLHKKNDRTLITVTNSL